MNEERMSGAGDEELRARFGELRAKAGRSTPPFAAMLERAATEAREQPTLTVVRGGGSRRRALRVGAWASGAVAATVAGLLLFDGGSAPTASADEQFAELIASYASDMAAGAWRSPTSSLLDVPGIELMRSVPSIGPSSDAGAPR
jgi:hypothetical protein